MTQLGNSICLSSKLKCKKSKGKEEKYSNLFWK
jgi:hypothetical protein